MRTLAPILLLTACATTAPPPPQGGPRGLRASEHRDAAHRHDELARQAWRFPDVVASPGPGAPTIPWTRSWRPDADHDRLAAVHRGKAAELEAAFDEACGARASEEVSISPLQRYGLGGWNTSTGVIVYLRPDAGPADRLLANLRCHRAWMMLAPTDMDACPLDLPGLQLDVRGDAEGITLALAVDDPKLVSELQRRAAHDLEGAARQRAQPEP
jgi:hypothetical protein